MYYSCTQIKILPYQSIQKYWMNQIKQCFGIGRWPTCIYLSTNTFVNPMTKSWVVFGFVLEQVSLNRLLHKPLYLHFTPDFIAPSVRGISGFTYFWDILIWDAKASFSSYEVFIWITSNFLHRFIVSYSQNCGRKQVNEFHSFLHFWVLSVFFLTKDCYSPQHQLRFLKCIKRGIGKAIF